MRLRTGAATLPTVLLFLLTVGLYATDAAAQTLLWHLPEDGTEVRYQGTIEQTDSRPGGQESRMKWDTELFIRSVGTQPVKYEGKDVTGRWIEFEVRTGRATERGIDPGPLGIRIFKLLVPEPAITGKPADERNLPNSFLPIVDGYLKQGADQPRKITGTAFRSYPSVSLMMNYKPGEIQEAGEQSITTPAGNYNATKYSAETTVESPGGRTVNRATIFVGDEMPFGPVRWSVEESLETKDTSQARDLFQNTTSVQTEMEVREIKRGVRSALTLP